MSARKRELPRFEFGVRSLLSACIAFSSCFSLLPVAGAVDPHNVSHSGPAAIQHAHAGIGGVKMVDGHFLLSRMVAQARQLESYTAHTQLKFYKDQRGVSESGSFSFKKPGMIKLDVTDGHRKGSCVVVSKNGEIHAHCGGLMKHLKIKLDRDSHMLRLSNGFSVVEGDFASFANYMSKLVSEQGHCKVTAVPTSLHGQKEKQYVLEVLHPKTGKDDATYHIAVDASTSLPVRIDIYCNGHLTSTTTWSNVVVNPGLSDDFFRL